MCMGVCACTRLPDAYSVSDDFYGDAHAAALGLHATSAARDQLPSLPTNVTHTTPDTLPDQRPSLPTNLTDTATSAVQCDRRRHPCPPLLQTTPGAQGTAQSAQPLSHRLRPCHPFALIAWLQLKLPPSSAHHRAPPIQPAPPPQAHPPCVPRPLPIASASASQCHWAQTRRRMALYAAAFRTWGQEGGGASVHTHMRV